VADRYDLRIAPTAARELRRIEPQAQARLRRAIRGLAIDSRPPGARLLTSSPEERIWRIRVGDVRVLCQVHDDRLVVLVVRVGPRGSVFR
jgi:mRNA interferase RelE/StbE